jgi:hypothetical protein
MKILKGWRRIDNQRGYINATTINATTGQNLIVIRTEFGEHYLVMLFPMVKNDDEEGSRISPEYATVSKAESFAMDWMSKHPRGVK